MIKIVCGLPASGKTTLINSWDNNTHELFDDFLSPTIIKTAILNKKKPYLVFSDPYFCRPNVISAVISLINTIKSSYEEVEIYSFENDPMQCLENSRNIDRQNKNVRSLILQLSKEYIPTGIIIPVYKK